MEQMKAIVYDTSIRPDKLSYRDVAKPVSTHNEVLIKICAVSVNAADYRSMQMSIIPKNKIFGADISGRVESVGKDIHQFKGVMHVSIWSIAILFSVIHIQFFGFFPRLIIGAWFGYLLWWTGSIWVPILAHFLNNALSTLTVFGQNKGVFTDNPDRWGLDQTWWLSLISLVLVAGTVRYFTELKKNR